MVTGMPRIETYEIGNYETAHRKHIITISDVVPVL
jgi:hypothetical protein